MSNIQPKVEELQKKYADDPQTQRRNNETLQKRMKMTIQRLLDYAYSDPCVHLTL